MNFTFDSVQVKAAKLTVWFQAKTVANQFQALSHHLSSSDLTEELFAIPYFVKRVSISKHADEKKIESLLLNSRNTEYILRSNVQILEHVEHACVLQWSFPQAYYSVFNSLRALYHVLGYSEADKSHTLILKKFASMAVEEKLPKSISFYSDGGKSNIHYRNITKPTGLKPMNLSLLDNETVHNQICQFLKSTREQKLDGQRGKYCLDYKKIHRKDKHSLSQAEWEIVSSQVGPTTIMDLLYRKRIKSNYENIDSFVSEEFKDGALVLKCICNLVYQLNYTFEMYMCRAMGAYTFEKMLKPNQGKYGFADNRARKILELSQAKTV